MRKKYFRSEAITSSPLYYDGHVLSPTDNWRVRCAVLLHIELIQDAVEAMVHPLLRRGHSGITRNCSPILLDKLRDDILSHDLSLWYGELKKLLLVFRHLPFDGGALGPCKARKVVRRLYQEFEVQPSFTSEFFLPFFSIFLRTGCLGMLLHLNSMLQFESHLTLNDVDWVEEEEIQKYIQTEALLKKQAYDTDLLDTMRGIILEWLSDFKFLPTTPHGYGATKEVNRGIGTSAKFGVVLDTISKDNLETMLATGWLPAPGQWSPLGEWLTACSINHAVLDSFPSRTIPGTYMLVPKGVDSKRGVSMEPTANMLCQGPIMESLVAHFESHPWIGYTPRSQEMSQCYARIGSINRAYATIDLSQASDTVTHTLVRVLFQGTQLYQAMSGCRTTHVELPNGQVVLLEKWAPMGSKLCFPIMSLILCALVAAVSMRTGYHYRWVVYGDDIIVHRSVYNEVLKALEGLGFKINVSKSYPPEAPFKESCGMEAFAGMDVTAIRLGRRFDPVGAEDVLFSDPRKASSQEPYSTQLNQLYDLGNSLYQYGYLRTRKRVIELTQHLYPGCLFSHYFEQGFFTPGEIRHPYLRRSTIKFGNQVVGHQVEAKHQFVVSDHQGGSAIQRYWLDVERITGRPAPRTLPPDDGWCIRSRVGPSRTKVTWSWVPVGQYE